MHHDQIVRLVTRALAAGATRTGVTTIEWDVAGRCQAPVPREISVRPGADERDEVQKFIDALARAFPGIDRKDAKGVPPDRRRTRQRHVVVRNGTKVPLTLLMHVPCRKCDPCRRKRSMIWSMKAKAETQAAVRTWFGTLTLSPAAHMTMLSRARVALATQGVDMDTLTFGEQFLGRHRECSIEITKYLKRVRKESGANFRYLLVAEHHASGLPHYHLLVHERVGNVKHSTLSKQWLLGFEKWRLLTDLREATYLCKYLSKATVARVRASVAYGTAVAIAKRENDPPKDETKSGGAAEAVSLLGHPEEEQRT